MPVPACAGTCIRFLLLRRRNILGKVKIVASARSELPFRHGQNYRISAKIAKKFLIKSKNTIDKRRVVVYNTVKRLNKYSEVQKNARRSICPSGKVNKTMKKAYNIEVDCANCALLMEEAAKKTDGVKDASVNFMLLKMTVEFEDGADEHKVMKQVLRNCRKVEDDCDIEL